MRALLITMLACSGILGLGFSVFGGYLLGRSDYVGALLALLAGGMLARAARLWSESPALRGEP